MDSLKDRKVLPINGRRKESDEPAESSSSESSSESAPVSWEEEYFARLSESARTRDNAEMPSGRAVVALALKEISASPFQTRELGNNDELEELKNSIISRGVIQPVLVRRLTEDSGYELIAGERRFRASVLAGLTTIPALIEDLNDQESLELSIIENAQRENLNPIEEAKAYQLLADRFKLTHVEIAKIVGKNRATISNSLRLLALELEVIELLRTGELTAGHGRALLMIEDPGVQLQLARLAVKKALSVRALENFVSRLDEDSFAEEETEIDEKLEQSLRRTEQKIGSMLGLEKVKLSTDGLGGRKLSLSFETEASWKRFMAKIRD